MEFKVLIDKFIATKKQGKYLYEFQFSSVDRCTLHMLTDLAACNLSGAWSQPDGSYIVQCSFNELPEELLQGVFNAIT